MKVASEDQNKYKKWQNDRKVEPSCTFFLFINSGSGAGLGSKIVSQEVTTNKFRLII